MQSHFFIQFIINDINHKYNIILGNIAFLVPTIRILQRVFRNVYTNNRTTVKKIK